MGELANLTFFPATLLMVQYDTWTVSMGELIQTASQWPGQHASRIVWEWQRDTDFTVARVTFLKEVSSSNKYT